LENAIHRAVVLANGETISPEQLPCDVRDDCEVLTIYTPMNSEELKQRKKELREKSVEDVERRFVTEALNRNDWNVTRASKDVGMQRQNFQTLMRRHRISPPQDATS
jgi:DNA-binding NtrC family response regulator